MPKITLTEDQRTTLTNGLRVAVERFKEHVNEMGEWTLPDHPYTRLRVQFERQAQESVELAELLEGCEKIEVIS